MKPVKHRNISNLTLTGKIQPGIVGDELQRRERRRRRRHGHGGEAGVRLRFI